MGMNTGGVNVERGGVKPPPSQYNFAEDVFTRNRQREQKIAFIDDDTQITYGDLKDHSRRLAAALAALGLREEERVLLLMHDSVAWPVCFLGSLWAGVVPVAVNTLQTPEDYAYVLEHSGCRAAIVSAALLPVLAAALQQADHRVEHVVVAGEPQGGAQMVAPMEVLKLTELIGENAPRQTSVKTHADDMAFWLYSSGSTGRPKATVHAQGSLYWTAALYGEGVLGLSDKDVCFSAAKLFFAYGLGNGLSFPLSVGATVVLMSGRPTPDAVFAKWSEHSPTVFFGAPTGYAGMLASPSLPVKGSVALRLCSSAGEALPKELGRRFNNHFDVEVIDGIGSTEMLHIYLSNAPGQLRYGTTGWPVPGYEVELRDESGDRTPQGEVGELFVRGPSAAMMYWGDRDKSRQTFQGEWTKSGDQYRCNEDGSYTYVGRSDDMFKVSGIYVSPFEVEGTLIQHPSVLESAVVGLPDEDGLIKSKAFVVLKEGHSATEEELQGFVKEKLAPYKYPRAIDFVEELPKTATGKVMRFKLRQ